ncbi:glutamine-synthetase adenylyltransferase [Rhodovulum sp. FJ3]|uniref:[protein-PII] uridylyltransferase family protein n=1 Tax=Rhodovulum sp. FJ3 TaxID=3079053 RepID=UPI00293DA37E|nr:glutamine-synthetase adenylyltransferase [Rhodovulum sp. FJ3]MDV4166671.1 glutamine-synthetase adenylyltransferase [Rhodovulum sp. FJ3]
MTLETMIRRVPLVFDPDCGTDVPDVLRTKTPPLSDLLAGTAGCSPYLKSLLHKEAAWLSAALGQPIEGAFDSILSDVSGLTLDQLPVHLRQAKRRAALWIALADLSGAWDLEQVTGALTRFADLCVDVTIKRLIAAEIARGKLPGMTEDDVETGAGMVALAMGKHGAGELNYSSDIDLICLFDQDRFDPDDYHDARAAFVRVTRKMSTILSDITGDGYVFRTDLRLRPDAQVTPVCMAMAAAESYYESVGRTWERAAHIKARPCAGDIDAGWAYLERLRPFVWRKHLDFAAIQDAHNMRLAIRDHKGLHGALTLGGHNLKLGQGGIREIEFFTQTRQIIAGGRDPDLRVRGTVEGLARLADKGWIPQEVAATLTEDYRTLREVEHRLQMVNDAQTHSMPTSDTGIDRIARFCGDAETSVFADRMLTLFKRVDGLTEDFFAPTQRDAAATPLPDFAAEFTGRWRTYPALRSARAVELFDRLKPAILERLTNAARPQEAFAAFDGFLSGLPAGVQVFSLFDANPQLIDLIVDIATTAPELARYLSRNASVFDAVIGGGFFAPWPGPDALVAELSAHLPEAGDYERQLDAARRWAKEWHFRIGVHLLRGLISAEQAGEHYADLAGAVVAGIWPAVVDNFAAKHGVPPGRGACVIGMGSLGAERLGPRSDLDLIVIYDPDGAEMSEGRRPLNVRAYYARLTQALVTALTAPMAEGRLYEVDMRLRPSGNQGPVATSVQAFRDYQQTQAWTWEHLALTRARPIAGAPDLMAEVEAFRRDLLAAKSDPDTTLQGVAEMRARLAAAKPPKGPWDVKLGPGRIQDIELVASAAALIAANPATEVIHQLTPDAPWPDPEQARALNHAYCRLRQVETAAKLLSDKPLDPSALGQGGGAFVLRTTEATSLDDLAARLAQLEQDSAAIIDALLPAVSEDAE